MISVIIPCYKAEKTLRKCVRSILNQTFTELEVILVEDCSPDRTKDICLSMSEADSRVKTFLQPTNKGVDAARFRGIAEARGEYLMFIDSDDWINGNDILLQMHQTAVKENADIVMAGMRRVLDKACLIKGKIEFSEYKVLDRPKLFDDYYLSFFGVNILPVSMCAKLYRKSVIDKADLKPSGLCMGEDLHFNMILFPHLQRIAIMPIVAYNYRFGGMTSGYNNHLFEDMLSLYNTKKGLIEKYNYRKASDFIIIEMVNVLRSEICQVIRFKSADEAHAFTKKLLDLSLWDDIDKISQHPQWLALPFTKAVNSRDVDTVLSTCIEIERKNRLPYLTKRIISGLLSIV